jgi:hypothetical protein
MHEHTYIYIYLYIYVCVQRCVCVSADRRQGTAAGAACLRELALQSQAKTVKVEELEEIELVREITARRTLFTHNKRQRGTNACSLEIGEQSLAQAEPGSIHSDCGCVKEQSNGASFGG